MTIECEAVPDFHAPVGSAVSQVLVEAGQQVEAKDLLVVVDD